MAEKVSGTWDWATYGGRAKYPWSEWIDGSIWKIRQGVDFDMEIHNMRATLCIGAKRYGRKVRTHMDEEDRGILYFQMYVPEEEK